jgi:zinc protease
MEVDMNRRLRLGLALLIIIGLLAVSGAFAQMEGVKQVKLPNGLTVVTKENHAAPVFTAQIWFKVGSRNEHTGITGISHLLEHMLFTSSKHFKKGEISKLVHEKGGIDNAATWTDFTYYWDLLSSEHLEFAISTLAEKAGNALLLNPELQKERVVVLSELEGNENNPDRLLYQAVMAQAFVASGYHWPTIGFRSDVENIDRQQLVDYYDSYYHPNNATLVLVGDFNTDHALALVKKYFSSLPTGKLPRPPYTVEPPQRGQKRVIVHREGTAARVLLGYHVPSLTDPDSYPLTVLDQILSGGRSSRLYQALVEKQLATSAWSSAGNRIEPSLFMLGATVMQNVTPGDVEAALLEQVETAKNKLPSPEEMQSAKNQLEAYFIYQNDSVSDQGEQLGYYSTVANLDYLRDLVSKIKAVTPQQVQDVARKYFTTDNLTVGTFMPTGEASGAIQSEPVGPIQNTIWPGLCNYRDTTASSFVSAKAETPATTAAGPVKEASQLIKPHRTVLDNGLVVIVQENHSNPTVAIAGNVKAGSVFDPEGKNGVAALTANMLDRGTSKRTSLEIANQLEFVAAQLDTSADVESALFEGKSLKKDFELLVDILSDELRNASFPADQFEKARAERLSNLQQSKESPKSRASRAFFNSVYPVGHPYHRLTVEQAQEALNRITRDDVADFHAKYYRPDTMIIVISGDVDPKQATELVKKYFGDWKTSGPKPVVDIPTIEPPKQGGRIVIPMMDKAEVDVVYGFPLGMKRSNLDYYAFRIANQILGGAGALTSILGEDIRERSGLVYNVVSSFDAGLGAGPWFASLGSSSKNADQAIDLLEKDVKQFAAKGATQAQFKRAQEFVVGVFPIALETNSGVASMLRSVEFYDLGIDFLQRYAGIYRSVTLDQVNAAAKKYIKPESATLVIAGPYEEKK